ncbi:ABC transporter permease [Pseudonocardia sulfidoxydans NBRC 16205]|uniref:ABC transporter permease n=1 Tax=Pseudonocardia sulfidoxydans NBRC 16205 TaxID=1223511 RepID=A0A511DE06_9PSEU|nr:ABC transporter permease [Pseudonocardia sulfidoxydans]GEL21208.1 ABC transporter permease [Pseudonocardia sulfidoxydans NBRC 16205]
MVTIVGRRIVAIVPVLLIVSFLTFSLTYLVPGDAASIAAGDNASAEQIELVRRQLGLDRPFLAQYASWLWHVVQGGLGTSLLSSRSVLTSLTEALPVTLSLTLLAMLFAIAAGLLLGIVAGLRPGSALDRIATTVASLGISMPSFWLALILVNVVALQLGLAPVAGYTSIAEGGLTGWFQHLLLPAVALGTITAAELTRQTRAGVVDVSEQDYIRTAVAKGLPTRLVVVKHTLKNAAIPVVTVLGLQFGGLVGGAIVIERIFGLPGLGTLAIDSVLNQDFPVVQGLVLMITLFVLLVSLLVDTSYLYFNPKVRQS